MDKGIMILVFGLAALVGVTSKVSYSSLGFGAQVLLIMIIGFLFFFIKVNENREIINVGNSWENMVDVTVDIQKLGELCLIVAVGFAGFAVYWEIMVDASAFDMTSKLSFFFLCLGLLLMHYKKKEEQD